MQHYFRFWLLAPLLLGLGGLLVPAVSVGVIPFAETALLVAGVPYTVFVVGALTWARRRSEAQYKLAFPLSPLVFGLCGFGYWLVVFPFMGREAEPWSLVALTGLAFGQVCTLVSAAYCWPPLLLWYAVARVRRG